MLHPAQAHRSFLQSIQQPTPKHCFWVAPIILLTTHHSKCLLVSCFLVVLLFFFFNQVIFSNHVTFSSSNVNKIVGEKISGKISQFSISLMQHRPHSLRHQQQFSNVFPSPGCFTITKIILNFSGFYLLRYLVYIFSHSITFQSPFLNALEIAVLSSSTKFLHILYNILLSSATRSRGDQIGTQSRWISWSPSRLTHRDQLCEI